MYPELVLGLDPATVASGWAILAVNGADQEVRNCGTYRAPGKERLGQLASIYEWALGLVDQWAPVLVAVETVYHGPSPRTTIRLAEVGAVVRLAAHHAGAVIVDIAPSERIGAIGLGGRPDKADLIRAVNVLYRLELSDHNAADAVAIAAAGAVDLKRSALGFPGLMLD